MSQTRTCFATSTASVGVTNTMAAAMNAPKNTHKRELAERRAPDRGYALGQPGMVRMLFGRVRRQRQCFFVADLDDVIAARSSSERARDVAHEVRDPLLGICLGGDRELLVVVQPDGPDR